MPCLAGLHGGTLGIVNGPGYDHGMSHDMSHDLPVCINMYLIPFMYLP